MQFPQHKYSPLWLWLGSWLKISFPELWGWEWRKPETISSVLALIHFSVFTMVLPGRAYVHEYVRRNLSNLWQSNWRRKKLKKKGSQFIWKYFYSENCFKYHYLYLKKHITHLKKRGWWKIQPLSLSVSSWVETGRPQSEKKIQIARNIAWGRAIKKEETKYWNHTWCLTKWMKSNFAL